MNYISEDDAKRKAVDEVRTFKKNVIIVGVLLVLIMVVANFVVLSSFKTGLSQQVADNLTSEVVENVESNVAQKVTDNLTAAVLTQYTREYKLRDADVTVGTYVASKNLGAVLDIVCRGEKVSGGTIVASDKINYSYSEISSTATGMVINEQGYVLTNAHVILHDDVEGEIVVQRGMYGIKYTEITKEYTTVLASFYGETTQYELQIVAYDAALDLAVLKLITLPEKFSQEGFDDYVTFGDSDALELGEASVVIGNAYDLGISVTTGTITNTHPDLSGFDVGQIYSDGEIIQTDTAINGGNSGGPMFDSTACCIGVASFKIATSSTEGLGFAIASNLAVKYIYYVSETLEGQKISIYTFYSADRYNQIIA